MKKFRNLIACAMAFTTIAGTSAPVLSVSANDSAETSQAYSYTTDGETFSFYDYSHNITISDGSLKNGKDISFYGLNDEGSLAVVYFNTEANEGKGVVAGNDSMIYVTYENGEISEVERPAGTQQLFNFDMSLADSSMTGMMKVFNASLGGFLQAYSSSQKEYSTICDFGSESGTINYVNPQYTELILMDDNYITNKEDSANEAFMANEWGIYSGYNVIDGVDYSTYCFFGTHGDVYYYGFSKAENGFNVVTMKGTVSEVDERTKVVSLKSVDMSVPSDNASQYITKMAGCLMSAQGKTSLNLDTLTLDTAYQYTGKGFRTVIEASTSTASGTLTYNDGCYSGTITDENGNTEELSVKSYAKNYIVTSQTSGTFTVSKKKDFWGFYTGSLENSAPYAQQCVEPSFEWDWFFYWTYGQNNCNWIWNMFSCWNFCWC